MRELLKEIAIGVAMAIAILLLFGLYTDMTFADHKVLTGAAHTDTVASRIEKLKEKHAAIARGNRGIQRDEPKDTTKSKPPPLGSTAANVPMKGEGSQLCYELGGRCGPEYHNCRCPYSEEPYCNPTNGWCGNSAGHFEASKDHPGDFNFKPKAKAST